MHKEHLQAFIKQNFRPLKTKENAPIMIGRDTYEWVLGREKKKSFSRLTVADVEKLIDKYQIKQVDFEDGVTYIVHPDADKQMLVEWYAEESERENPITRTLLKPKLDFSKSALDKADPAGEAEGEEYFISELALGHIAPAADAGKSIALLVSELTPKQVIDALDDNHVRFHYEEAEIHVLAHDEEPGDSPVYPAVFPAPLPGTEISLQQLDVSQRTALDGAYRDTVEESSHSVEHTITKAE